MVRCGSSDVTEVPDGRELIVAFRGTVLKEEWAIDADVWRGPTPLTEDSKVRLEREEEQEEFWLARGWGGTDGSYDRRYSIEMLGVTHDEVVTSPSRVLLYRRRVGQAPVKTQRLLSGSDAS